MPGHANPGLTLRSSTNVTVEAVIGSDFWLCRLLFHWIDIRPYGYYATPLCIEYSTWVALRHVWENITLWTVRQRKSYCSIVSRFWFFVDCCISVSFDTSIFGSGLISRVLHVQVEACTECSVFDVNLPLFERGEAGWALRSGHRRRPNVDYKYALRLLNSMPWGCRRPADTPLQGAWELSRIGNRAHLR